MKYLTPLKNGLIHLGLASISKHSLNIPAITLYGEHTGVTVNEDLSDGFNGRPIRPALLEVLIRRGSLYTTVISAQLGEYDCGTGSHGD